jgi:hypothetical protein
VAEMIKDKIESIEWSISNKWKDCSFISFVHST